MIFDPTRADASDPTRLPGWRLVLFSVIGLAVGGVQTAVMLYLPAFYAQRFALDLTVIGTIFMICRLLNAFSDPIIGILSDRTETSIGRRKPWVIGGGLFLLVATAAIFIPPEGVGAAYLAVALLATYLGISALSTPLYAWAGGLSPLYHERTRNQTYLQTVVSLGLVATLAIPLILQRSFGFDRIGQIASMGEINVAALAIGIPILLFGFRERPAPSIRRHLAVRRTLTLLATDRLVLRVIGSDFFVSVGQGFRGALLVLFVTIYMGLPGWALAIPLIQFGFGVLASPIWARIGYRLGKSRTVIAAEFTQIAVNLGLLFLAPGDLWPLVALTVMQGLSQGSGNLMLRAIVSDVADKERLETGKDHSGLLFSIFNVTVNVGMALAIGFALQLVGWFGFAPARPNSDAALLALKLTIGFGPALGHLLSAALMWRFPLDEAKHAQIMEALRKSEAAAPPSLADSPSLRTAEFPA